MKIRPIDTYVFCGPRPKTQADLDEILKLGVKHFVSLQTGAYEALHDDAYEQAGVERVQISCSDIMPPTKDNTIRVIRSLRFCQTVEAPVFFHCLHGRDRTGWMVAAYRIIAQGWTEERALEEYLNHGLHWVYRFWWPRVFRKRGFKNV